MSTEFVSYVWLLVLDQIFVFFPEEAKVGVKTMKTYTNRMKSENVSRAILVVQQNLTPFAKTCISEISHTFHLEVFQVSFLVISFSGVIKLCCQGCDQLSNQCMQPLEILLRPSSKL